MVVANTSNSELATTGQIAMLLGISRERIYRHVTKAGLHEKGRVSREMLWDADDLDRIRAAEDDLRRREADRRHCDGVRTITITDLRATGQRVAPRLSDATLEPSRVLAIEELRHELEAALSKLPPRERAILMMRHDLDGEHRTLAAVGRLLNLTRERVRQLQDAAEEKVRRVIRARLGG